LRAVFAVDERLQLLDQKSPVISQLPFAAFALGWIDAGRGGRIFMNAIFARVRDRHDDERLHQFAADEALRGFVHPPFHARKGSRGVENILAVMQIKHRVMPLRRSPVARREIDQDVAPVAQDFRSEICVALDITGERRSGHEKRRYRGRDTLCPSRRDVSKFQRDFSPLCSSIAENHGERFLDFVPDFARMAGFR
jgi:hypothetical protein